MWKKSEKNVEFCDNVRFCENVRFDRVRLAAQPPPKIDQKRLRDCPNFVLQK